MYRVQVYDGQTLGLHWQRHKGGKEHQEAGKSLKQQKIPVAIALGGDPAAIWSGSAPLPPGIDEFLLANWLRRKPTTFVKCVTQDLEVPANGEFVIEGWFDPNEHRMEGPFGDHTGFYTPQDLFPVMRVTAITHRQDAIYPTTIVGKPPMEDVWMGKATERLFLPLMKLFMGEIVDVNMPAEGIFHNLVIVSIKQRFPGHAQKIMYGLWGLGLMMLAKGILVVDADVNVQNLAEVANQVIENVDWRRDVTVVDGAVDQLDHSAIQDSYGGKIGVDATRSTRPEFMTPLPPPTPIPAAEVTALVGDHWCETHRTLIVALDKGRMKPQAAMQALWKLCPDHNLVIHDLSVDVHNLSDVAWRTLGNVDWRRDIVIHNGPVDHYAPAGSPRGNIGIDATSKTAEDGHPRGFPEEIVMSPEVIERVNRRWSEYGFK
jgi:4-hydroxy-3-polyprenylbenzoate decarboxylase